MRKHLLYAAILLASISVAIAELPEEIFGTWKGQRIEYINGQRYLFSQVTSFRRKGDGMQVGGSMSIGSITLIAKGEYKGNGQYGATMFREGRPIASTSGRWTARGDTIHVRGRTIQVGTPPYSANSQTRLVGKNRLVVVSALAISGGGNVTINMRRVK